MIMILLAVLKKNFIAYFLSIVSIFKSYIAKVTGRCSEKFLHLKPPIFYFYGIVDITCFPDVY